MTGPRATTVNIGLTVCEFEAFKTLDCYTIHCQNCNTCGVGVTVYKTQAFCNLEYNIEKAPADLIILQSKGLNLGDLFYCVGLKAPRKKQAILLLSKANKLVAAQVKPV